jgi:SAM-dependent methyltransferase
MALMHGPRRRAAVDESMPRGVGPCRSRYRRLPGKDMARHPIEGMPSRTFIWTALQDIIMEKRLDKVFRERLIRDESFGELRPHSLLVEVVSGGLVPRGRALNLHCGMGSDSLYLAQEGFVVAAASFTPGEVEGVKRLAEEAKAKVSTFTVEPTNLPFHEGEFDFIADTGCILKVDEGERGILLRELYRTLRRGGRMFTMLPNYKDSPDGVTRASIEEMFHPPFEVLVVNESTVADEGGKADAVYYYSVLLEKV